MVIRLSVEEARRVAVVAAGLAEPAPGSLVEAVHTVAGVRVETTTHVCTSAEHILHTRLGAGFAAADAATALARGELFEREWILRPADELPLHLVGCGSWPDRAGVRGWMEANAPFARGLLDRIADAGPSTSRELPDEAIVPWASSGWNDDRNVARMLNCLHMTGELAVVAHDARFRVFDLAERVYPPGLPEVPEAEARLVRRERLLASLGVARRTRAHGVDNAELGEEAEIAGVPGRWRVDPVAVDRARAARLRPAAVLSPFDRLLSDQHRTALVFDFDYRLEMYTPARARRWGYFALPVLLRDRLAGKIDARTDRDAGELRVDAIHEDDDWTTSEREAVRRELDALARFLGVALRIA